MVRRGVYVVDESNKYRYTGDVPAVAGLRDVIEKQYKGCEFDLYVTIHKDTPQMRLAFMYEDAMIFTNRFKEFCPSFVSDIKLLVSAWDLYIKRGIIIRRDTLNKQQIMDLFRELHLNARFTPLYIDISDLDVNTVNCLNTEYFDALCKAVPLGCRRSLNLLVTEEVAKFLNLQLDMVNASKSVKDKFKICSI